MKQAKRRGAHRRKRARSASVGMMLHQDGSRYEWVPGMLWDLIVTLDDATSAIYSAFLVEEEGTMSSFQGVQEVIETEGLFSSLYADRGSHYWYTPEAGGEVDKTRPTQFHRALQQLGIELIAAYFPEARGRSERAFRTLQDRLPKELALEGITDQASANRYLKEVFISDYNRRFAVPAPEPGSAFVPWVGGSLADILCVQEERTVANDNTVRYLNRVLQIPQDRYRCHYVKAKVRVHEHLDGTLAIFHGPRCLGRYDARGHLLAPAQVAAVQSLLSHRSRGLTLNSHQRTDNVLPKPDKLTCFLQALFAQWHARCADRAVGRRDMKHRPGSAQLAETRTPGHDNSFCNAIVLRRAPMGRRRRKPATWNAGKIALVLILAIALVAVTGLLLANLVFTVLIAIGSFTAGFLLGRSPWRSAADLIPRSAHMPPARGKASPLVRVRQDNAVTDASPAAPVLEAPTPVRFARRRRSS